ncbi:MAG: DUF2079 domain-containing protein [Archangium sp.]
MALRVPSWAAALLGLLPVVLWLVGVFPMDAARVCGVLALVGFVASRDESEQPRLLRAFSFLLVLAVPVAVGVHLFLRLTAGLHGIDFAIFSQVVHSIATTGRATTSLLSEQPFDFLSHHFVPVFYVPGALALLGVPAPVALILVSTAALLGALLALRRFCLELGLDPVAANAWALVVGLSVSIRPEMLWGVHDEVLALPLLGWSLVRLQQGKLAQSLVLLLLCAAAKESFFLLTPFWLVLCRIQRRDLAWTRVERLAAVLAVVWPAIGGAYVFLQPLISGREFDHLNKFDLAFLREHLLLADRALFLVLPFVSLGPLPLLGWKAIRWGVISVPFFLLCVVSSDPEMFRPTGYHAAVPAFLIAFAGAVGLKTLTDRWPRLKTSVFVLVCAQLSFGATSLWLVTKRVPSEPWYPSPQLVSLVGTRTVAADPAAALALLPSPHLSRLWAIRAEAPPDFIIAKPDGWEAVPDWAIGHYVEVASSPGWRVLEKKQF